jgi:hypothetical protein
MVYSLSRYVNSLKPVIPQSTIDKPPSAELRPGQKDSDTLPPYEILDNILEDYVEDYRTAEQIAAERGYEVRLVRDVIRMIERSEYKRQQAAPGLKITPKLWLWPPFLSPKSGQKIRRTKFALLRLTCPFAMASHNHCHRKDRQPGTITARLRGQRKRKQKDHDQR